MRKILSFPIFFYLSLLHKMLNAAFHPFVLLCFPTDIFSVYFTPATTYLNRKAFPEKIIRNMASENQSLWYLENLDVTGIFCPTKMEGNDRHRKYSYNKGEYIYVPEEDSNKIFFVFAGKVKVGTINDEGKEITKAILDKGEVFGELAAIGEQKRRDFAVATEKSTVCVLPASDIKSMIKENRGLSMFLMKIMGKRVLETEHRLESLVFKDSRSRIVEFICKQADEKGQRVGFETVIRNFITHQEVANMTATSRQTVTTILNELRNDNLLTFNRRRLLIRDLETLRKQIVKV